MYSLNKIKQTIAEEVNRIVGADIVLAENLVYPPNAEMGDLSLPCFVLAKQLGKNPAQVAEFLVGQIKSKGAIAGVSALGPYFNIKLVKNVLASSVIHEINEQKEKYGINESGERQKLLIEFSNVNTHKEYHAGHLRNLCYGDAVTRIMSANDYQAIPVSYVNDFGIHVAKTLWALIAYYLDDKLGADIDEDLKKVPDNGNRGAFLGGVYVKASQELKENKIAKSLVEIIMKKIESRSGQEYALWQKTREWSIAQFAKIYEELGVNFIKTYYESEFIDRGRELVFELLDKGILRKSEGAVIADLEEYGLGVLVVLRTDGTATYPVADIPLAMAKFKEYEPDASIYIVDIRQALYFKQLFQIMKLMDYKKPMIHLGYDVVKLPTGMMSSRSGNVITYEDLKEKLISKASAETVARHPEWAKEKIDSVVNALVKGTIKFEMLKIGQDQPITFDMEKALSFSGFTAAYLQYTFARMQSIIRKDYELSKKLEVRSEKDFNLSNLTEEKEHKLVLKLAKYPEAVKQGGKNFDPSEIARYLFELAQELNDYYHSVPILKVEADVCLARLQLIVSACQIISNGLGLLGIETIDEM
ncbi:MAG: Arginine-tRNA ligase [Candidatus Falkowbacteria bacterium GW2011_GWC2_38_22]|uniref:Arginine--tRNA ligase n=1 Tax=Candidatus Falkowbacteria bacterium GW2011_GWE1_38_31 TaxID=1618638 RepID=A0A0G0MBM3_9BACT|nr:MAG: Arginine-tRNA ligase [Candidatus Falkowbacteria bacterium GW2011_GWF2_38_1205]KKQ61388.1 MAG: Arginine-tRNA ligase [Candidatus Falkowbacteria bacterium GW2011_GWC2_38_22]KKQ64029.1 MAG: Arginine-tRNA ligase [Candidatus Falkowbacteria bacterium GW2011_GWF1_38_22]KKQ66623.1 MAG: Arginine-tRNA ligase [Candidatus Falkowbacteria bacterium GW2011_GWE2_38_254]KKQ71134.1 MAG: Arginine-tRNA ligase [Candidatus Falkowbacteria bacterium GW2011_GWE1_38_31]KKQ73260.1 MAG: Arginine-tRNA ligase [Candi